MGGWVAWLGRVIVVFTFELYTHTCLVATRDFFVSWCEVVLVVMGGGEGRGRGHPGLETRSCNVSSHSPVSECESNLSC